MPDFTNPFPGLTPERKLTTRELVRALRLDIVAEEDAIQLYESQADAIENPFAKKVLQDVANEERVHVGEFQQVISTLLEDEAQWLENGAEEVREMAAEVARGDLEPATPAEKKAEEEGGAASGDGHVDAGTAPTIGSMRP